ncbi:protein SLC31A2-like [Prorops nasuta]|uniref:protein SLC31A2-like n=1 Tax=Prorops nasuta TaxID=863751 RepID=UPI0034CF7C9B
MHMYYWFGYDLGAFLFEGYYVKTKIGFICTCLGLIAAAILYEAMKILQIRLQKMTIKSLIRCNQRSSENSSLLSTTNKSNIMIANIKCGSWYYWILQTSHWCLHTVLGYFLMLAIMTYNAYITLSIAFGACLGYWIFGPTLIELNLNKFHKRRSNAQCTSSTCPDATLTEERRLSTASIVAEQLIAEATVDIHSSMDID